MKMLTDAKLEEILKAAYNAWYDRALADCRPVVERVVEDKQAVDAHMCDVVKMLCFESSK